MRPSVGGYRIVLFAGLWAITAACSTPAGGGPSAAAPASSAPATSASPPPTPSVATSDGGSGGGRGDYDYDYGTVASPSAPSAGSVEVRVASGELGEYLTDAEGMTLYTFKPDPELVSTCDDSCADAWPPLTVDATTAAVAGGGVTGTLATFERSDGILQVAYDGAPLYYFARDVSPGDVNGHGAGDAWFVATP